MKHGVLKHWHPMVGVDFHIPWPPGSPSPAPSAAPYKTGMLMIGTGLGVLAQITKPVPDHPSDSWGFTMLKGTDIGPLIPHIGVPSVTLPVEMLFSASKSHFGCSQYKTKGTPIAVSLLFVVNPNLNCGTPIPTPTGVVFAITRHRVDMSWGDILAGALNMLADFLIQAALNKLGNVLGGALTKYLTPRLFSRFLPAPLALALSRGGDRGLAEAWAGVMAAGRAEGWANAAGTVLGTTFGFLVGGPMGADISAFGGYGTDSEGNAITPGGTGAGLVGSQADAAGQALDNYLNSPSAGDSPASPPVGDFPTGDPNAPMA